MQFVAWDGNTYDGSPPVGGTQATDGRWWPAGRKPQPPKGWYPDPTGRYSLRWWDGGRWTARASSSADTLVNDPLHPPPLSANAPKDGSPAAIDVSDLQATEDVVNQTEAEARILRLERDRLGLERGPVAVAGP